MPIHPKLIELGFLKYLQQNKDNAQLFEKELTKSVSGGTFSKNFSRKINRILTDILKINTDGKTPLHSFRHTFKDAGRVAEILEETSDSLTGHARKGTGGSYGTGMLLETKYNAIKKMTFEGFPL